MTWGITSSGQEVCFRHDVLDLSFSADFLHYICFFPFRLRGEVGCNHSRDCSRENRFMKRRPQCQLSSSHRKSVAKTSLCQILSKSYELWMDQGISPVHLTRLARGFRRRDPQGSDFAVPRHTPPYAHHSGLRPSSLKHLRICNAMTRRCGCRQRVICHWFLIFLLALPLCITPTTVTLPIMSAFTVELNHINQINLLNLMTLSRGPDQHSPQGWVFCVPASDPKSISQCHPGYIPKR